MRITFGQSNQKYYNYGSQRSENQSYKEPEKKDTIKKLSMAVFGSGCVGFALLKKRH